MRKPKVFPGNKKLLSCYGIYKESLVLAKKNLLGRLLHLLSLQIGGGLDSKPSHPENWCLNLSVLLLIKGFSPQSAYNQGYLAYRHSWDELMDFFAGV